MAAASAPSASAPKTFKAWYFKAGETKVGLIDYKDKLADLRKLLNCGTVGAQSVTVGDVKYTIWFNDNGCYEETEHNATAAKVLGKLPIRWGTMNGNFLVVAKRVVLDEDGCEEDEPTPIDIPSIGFREWIDACSKVIVKNHREMMKMFKPDAVISM